MKLSPKAFGLACGIFWGLVLCAATLLAVYTGYLKHLVDLMVNVYPYYEVSALGAVFGLLWGFVDGLIAGLIFAWIYNAIAPGTAS